jgi:hypothetical protein
MLAISTNYRTHQRKRVYNCPTLDWDIMSKNLQSTDIKDLSITMQKQYNKTNGNGIQSRST